MRYPKCGDFSVWKESHPLSGAELEKNRLLIESDPPGKHERVAGYVAKYLSKEHLHYGWSKYWVFPRFALVWQTVKRHTGYNMPLGYLPV